MIETLIQLEPEQSKAIKQLSEQTGVSEAEIVRKAVRQYLGCLDTGHLNLDSWNDELAYIRRLMGQQQVEQLPRTCQRDDLYDR